MGRELPHKMRGIMKRKYYLRGLGIGILVTAFILGITSDKPRAMTDEEVMARAKELGMVENTVLSNIGSNHPDTEPPETTPEEEKPDQTVPQIQPSEADDEEKETTQTVPETQSVEARDEEEEPDQTVPETQPSEADDEEKEPTQTVPETQPAEGDGAEEEPDQTISKVDGQTIILTIKRGESSSSVSRMLAEAGLVEDASAYDRYLCSNGYDKKIRTGVYEIPVGASQEEIARIISGGN